MSQHHGDATKVGTLVKKPPEGLTQWLYSPNITHYYYYSLGAGSERAEKRRCSRFSRRGAASLPRPAAAHPFGEEKKIHTERRRGKVARERVEEEKKKEARRVGRQAAATNARCEESDWEEEKEPSAQLEATLC